MKRQRKSTDRWMKEWFSGIIIPFPNISGKEDPHVL
jgi:hypothetical protein